MEDSSKALIEIANDWTNNFISIDGFADYYNMSSAEAHTLITIAKNHRESRSIK